MFIKEWTRSRIWSYKAFTRHVFHRFFHLFCILSICPWKISFSIKSKVLLSFSLKKHLDGWFWTKSPGNGFLLKENYLLTICVFYFYFDCLYRKYKKQWKITFFWMLMKHKRFNFQFAYRSTKLFINWKLLSYCCKLQLEELYYCNI